MLNIKFLALCVLLFMSGFSSVVLSETKKESVSGELLKLSKNFVATKQEIEAGAVVLKREIKHTSNNIGTFDSEYYIAVAILDQDAAIDYGHIELTANKYFTDIELEFARVLTPNGSVLTPKKDAVKYSSVGSNQRQTYNSLWQLSFALPRVSPGSFLEYKFRYKGTRPVIDGEWWSMDRVHLFKSSSYGVGGIRLDPVREVVITANIPKEKKLQSDVRNTVDYTYKKSVDEKETIIHQWRFSNFKSVKIEPGMPSLYEVVPYLGMTTVNKWAEINQWGIEHYRVNPTKSIRELSERITSGLANNEEKIKAIYYYLQKNLRYISADFNRNGVVPHSPEEVLKNGYGDCKDQANLFSLMLRSIGINAYPTLVNSPDSSDTKFDLPTLMFNHMIVFLPDSSKHKWVDLTGDRGLFPGLDPLYENAKVFVVDDQNGALTNIDNYKKDNKIEVIFDYITTSNPLKANITMVAKGGVGNRLKQSFRGAKNNDDDLVSILKSFHKASKVLSANIQNSAIDDPFILSGNLEFEDQWKQEGERLYIEGDLSQIVGTLTGFMGFQSKPDRQYPLALSQTVELSIKFLLPSPGADYYLEDVKSSTTYKSDFFNTKMLDTQKEDVRIKTLTFQIDKRNIDKNDYNKFVDDINKATLNSKWEIAYIRDKRIAETKKIFNKSINTSYENLTLKGKSAP